MPRFKPATHHSVNALKHNATTAPSTAYRSGSCSDQTAWRRRCSFGSCPWAFARSPAQSAICLHQNPPSSHRPQTRCTRTDRGAKRTTNMQGKQHRTLNDLTPNRGPDSSTSARACIQSPFSNKHRASTTVAQRTYPVKRGVVQRHRQVAQRVRRVERAEEEVVPAVRHSCMNTIETR